MVTKFGICLLLAFFLGSKAQVTTPGVCLDLRTEKNFDAFKASCHNFDYKMIRSIYLRIEVHFFLLHWEVKGHSSRVNLVKR